MGGGGMWGVYVGLVSWSVWVLFQVQWEATGARKRHDPIYILKEDYSNFFEET